MNLSIIAETLQGVSDKVEHPEKKLKRKYKPDSNNIPELILQIFSKAVAEGHNTRGGRVYPRQNPLKGILGERQN